MVKEHRYLTDDRDEPNRSELVIYQARNGDFYIGSAREGRRLENAVRICTSGGAASANPQLAQAVVDQFRALGGWDDAKEEDRVPLIFSLSLEASRRLEEMCAATGKSKTNLIKTALWELDGRLVNEGWLAPPKERKLSSHLALRLVSSKPRKKGKKTP